jgi:hypothetical protein
MPYEGGLLFAGQDARGLPYEPKIPPSGEYSLPSSDITRLIGVSLARPLQLSEQS